MASFKRLAIAVCAAGALAAPGPAVRAGQLVTNDGSFLIPTLCLNTPALNPSSNVNTTKTVVAGVAGQSIYVCGWDYGVQAAATLISFVLGYGTGTNCGTT